MFTEDNVESEGFGLHDLFTIKDYRLQTIEIPCHSNVVSSSILTTADVSSHHCNCGCGNDASGTQQWLISMELFHSPAACTDPELTGQVLWPVSILLSHYLASGKINLKGKSVLELGAGGTALPSITAARCGATLVVATDGNNDVVLDLLHRNIRHEQEISCHQRSAAATATAPSSNGSSTPMDATTTTRPSQQVRVPPKESPSSVLPLLCSRQLLWGHRTHLQSIRNENQQQPFHVIVAADVVQWPAVVEPLLHTAKAAMWHEGHLVSDAPFENDHASTTDSSVFIVGIVERSTAVYRQFFAFANEMGFDSREIDPMEFIPDGEVPKSCQEYGGRKTKLFELTLRHNAEVPILMQPPVEHGCLDYTVGRSFEQTLFLPC
jgi:predicted nicotinamide N-methyase